MTIFRGAVVEERPASSAAAEELAGGKLPDRPRVHSQPAAVRRRDAQVPRAGGDREERGE